MPDSGLSPRKQPRQQRSARTVDRIVAAATRVFDDVGSLDVTTNEIAMEAKVSVGSLYQYFPNKDALLVEVARRHLASSLAAFNALIGDVERPVDITQVIGRVIDLLLRQHEHDRLHLLIAHEAPRPAELEHELQRAREHMVDVVAALLPDATTKPHQRLIAAQLMVAILEVAVHDVILRQPQGPRREAAVAMTESAVTAIARS